MVEQFNIPMFNILYSYIYLFDQFNIPSFFPWSTNLTFLLFSLRFGFSFPLFLNTLKVLNGGEEIHNSTENFIKHRLD